LFGISIFGVFCSEFFRSAYIRSAYYHYTKNSQTFVCNAGSITMPACCSPVIDPTINILGFFYCKQWALYFSTFVSVLSTTAHPLI
jgi:hypothetical protein